MKLKLQQIETGDEEVIVRYRKMNGQIEAITAIVQETEPRIQAFWGGGTVLLRPEMIFYLENVDGNTYVYLEDKVARIPESLRAFGLYYDNRGFFRCSKSMILNIYKISHLKSEPGGRIRATLENGEQVMISRKYAKELRRVLRGGNEDEE